MRILFTLNSLRKGGIEKATIDTSRALTAAGHSVVILTFNDITDQEITNEDVVICVQSESGKKITEMIKALHKEQPFDLIIHTRHSIRTPWFKSTYYILHNVLSERLPSRTKYIKRWLKISRHKKELNNQNLICVSNAVKSDIYDLKIKPSSATTIPNLYNADNISRLSASDVNDIPKNYAISVGSFNKVKRHDILLAAFSNQSTIENLVIVGAGGPTEACTKELAHTLGIGNRVIFLGYRQNPYPYIKNAVVTIISSDSESFSSVVVESLILNTPVVTTDCLGPVEILGETYREFIAQRGNAKELGEKISQAAQGYPEIKNDIYQRYSPENVTLMYTNLIK